MSAEKQVVDYWLNCQGFFTITNLKAANRDVGILALKFSEGSVKEVWHVEVNCSITTSVSDTGDVKKLVGSFVSNHFNNQTIVTAINKYLKSHLGNYDYRKKLVFGSISRSRRDDIIKGFSAEGIAVIEFKDVLTEVMQKLDTQYYKNDIVRSMQLVKYLLLSEPDAVANLISVNEDIITKNNLSRFMRTLMAQDTLRNAYAQSATEKELGMLLQHSSLKSPEKLAKVASDILGKNSTRKFLITLLSQEKMSKTIPGPYTVSQLKSTIEKKQKPLKYFLKKV